MCSPATPGNSHRKCNCEFSFCSWKQQELHSKKITHVFIENEMPLGKKDSLDALLVMPSTKVLFSLAGSKQWLPTHPNLVFLVPQTHIVFGECIEWEGPSVATQRNSCFQMWFVLLSADSGLSSHAVSRSGPACSFFTYCSFLSTWKWQQLTKMGMTLEFHLQISNILVCN